MSDYRGGEWTEETQAEFERLYAIYDDGDRDKIFALLFEEKLALELHTELAKKAIRSLENKIDLLEGGIEAAQEIADHHMSEQQGTRAGNSFALIALKLEELL